jgi:hypothetical protein
MYIPACVCVHVVDAVAACMCAADSPGNNKEWRWNSCLGLGKRGSVEKAVLKAISNGSTVVLRSLQTAECVRGVRAGAGALET